MAKKNKLIDLNDHLFCQLERLGNEDLTESELNLETERTKSIVMVSRTIVENARLALDAQKALGECINDIPEMIGISHTPANTQ